MGSPTRPRARRPSRIDGLKVRVVDGPGAGAVDVGHTFRLLARLMVRNYQHAGDHEAIIPDPRAASTLTVSTHTSPDHDTNEAA